MKPQEPNTAMPLIVTVSKPRGTLSTMPATALSENGTSLLIGLQKGGIVVWDRKRHDGDVYRMPDAASDVTSLFFAEEKVWWRAADKRSYSLDTKKRTVHLETVLPNEPLPPITVVNNRRDNLYRLQDEKGHTWILGLPTMPYPPRPTFGAMTKAGLWWAMGNFVFHSADGSGNATAAYLPWAGASGTITGMIAEGRGVWVATNSGVRYLYGGQSPHDKDGYDGYVRFALDRATNDVPRGKGERMLSEVEAWQGVPYKYGGNDRTGIDCSAFVGVVHQTVGIELPRTSAAIAHSGRRVFDLRWGDLLCLPGHVAMHIGYGQTAEAYQAAVGKATIWRRTGTVIVRRFL